MKTFRKISVLFLSILVLLSSTSFTFGLHYCMGELDSVSIFSEAKPCDMEKTKSPCTSKNKNQDSDCTQQPRPKKSCCEDHILVVDGQDELSKVPTVSVPEFNLLAVFYAIAAITFNCSTVDHNSYNDYSPPLIERDIQVLVQSFLI